MNYAIYSKIYNGVQIVKNSFGNVIGVLIYDFSGNLKAYFESWEEYKLEVFGV